MRKHKFLAVILALVMTLTLLPTAALAEEDAPTLLNDEGTTWDGTSVDKAWYTGDSPYTISTAAGLAGLAQLVNGGNNFSGKMIILGADIDLNNQEWTSIGGESKQFKGFFDGNHKTISNLHVNGGVNSGKGYGLFGNCAGTIKNLTVTNAYVMGNAAVAAIAGLAGGTIENVHVTGRIEIGTTTNNAGQANFNSSYIGGIAGWGYGKAINCSVEGDGTSTSLIGGRQVGGIWGFHGETANRVVDGCLVKNISITGVKSVGGISGWVHYKDEVANCTVDHIAVSLSENAGDPDSIGLISGTTSPDDSNNCPVTYTNNKAINSTLNGTANDTDLYSMYGAGSYVSDATDVTRVYYERLSTAVNKAETGKTVVLLGDLVDTITIPEGKELIIDLNGYELTSGEIDGAAIVNNGTLTIKNGGLDGVTGNGQTTEENITKVTVEPIAVIGDAKYGTLQKAIDAASNNVVIKLVNDTVETVEISNAQVLTIDLNGCKITGSTYYTIDNYGVLSIQDSLGGGEVIGTSYTVYNNGSGTLNVKNAAKIRSTNGTAGYYGIAVYNVGTVNISGGTLLCANDDYWYHAPVYGGTVSITGGTFTKEPDLNYVADGYAADQNADGTWTVGERIDAAIGETTYTTVNEAAAAAQDGETVKLLRNVSLTSDLKLGTGSNDLNLDLNGKTIDGGTEYQVYTAGDGTINIYGGGTIKNNKSDEGASSAALYVFNGNTVILNDVAIEGNYTAIANYGDLTVLQANITSKQFGIGCFGEGSTVFGTENGDNSGIIVNSRYQAIASSVAYSPASSVIVYGGSYTTTGTNWDEGPIYWAGAGTLTVYDGVFKNEVSGTGTAAVYQKNGTINILGGTFISKDGFKLETKRLDVSTTISGGTFTGTRSGLYVNASATVPDNYKVSVSGGQFAGGTEGSIYTKTNGLSESQKALEISGGYFTSNPTAYVITGKTVLPSDKAGYTYMVGEPTKVEGTETEVAPAPETTPKADVDNMTSTDGSAASAEEKAAVETAIESATSSGLNTEAAAVANDSSKVTETHVSTGLSAAKTDLGVADNADASAIKLVVQPYLDIEAKSYTATETEKTLNVEITPKYNLLATKNDTDVTALNTTGEGGSKNAVIVESNKDLPTDENTQVTINFQLPSGFITDDAQMDKVFVVHTKQDRSTETYKATVTKSGSTPYVYTATFTTNGFSPFVFTVDTRSAQVQFEDKDGNSIGSAVTYLPTNVGDALPTTAAPDGQIFGGWQFADINGTYTTLTDALLTALDTKTDPITATPYFYTLSYGGGSGSSTTTYPVSASSNVKNGTVTVSPKNAAKGATVTITVKPDKGYELDSLTVTDKNGDQVKLTDKGNGKYTFTMPASKVDVKTSFVEAKTSGTNPFVDVSESAYYYDAVLWAVENGITGGTTDTTFSPNASCTRAQAVTFLWRAAGSPAPKSSAMPFGDVAADAYYHDAVLWAMEQGITQGTTATAFSPNAVCTRGQIVTFLWRAEASEAAGAVSAFTDVASNAYYAGAVDWAVENGITQGTTATTFSPAMNCTRAQIVTFLYRDYQGK